jgi:hypothetical protein
MTGRHSGDTGGLPAEDDAPPDLAEWSLHCFCLGARSTPHSIVRTDGNGRLLLAATEPVTLEQLRAEGLAPTESQLRLLEVYDLIERTDRTVQTTFPVLGPASILGLRGELEAVAAGNRTALAAAAGDVLAGLRTEGLAGSAFALVFGHALDGQFWDSLRRRGMLPSTTLSIEYPFWRGSFWASYPLRSFAAGTNEFRVEGATLTMVWTDATSEALAALARSEATRGWLEGIAGTAAQAPSHVRRPGGRSPIPLLRAGERTRLSQACEALAMTAADLVPDGSSCRQLLLASGVNADERTAAVIIAHELIWAIAEEMMSAGMFALPPEDDLDTHLLLTLG